MPLFDHMPLFDRFRKPKHPTDEELLAAIREKTAQAGSQEPATFNTDELPPKDKYAVFETEVAPDVWNAMVGREEAQWKRGRR